MNIMTEIGNIATGALLPAIYLVYQLPLLAAAGLPARRLRPRNWFEYLAAAGLLYALWTVALPGLLGLFGLLTPGNALTAAWVAGGVVWIVERERPRLKLPPLRLTAPELLLLALLVGFLGYQWRAYGCLPPVGTDAMIYHLYYPAVWNASGTVERLTQPGYVTASYPCYGELIYAWQMLSFDGDFIAKNWQFSFIVLAVLAAVAAVLAAGFHRMSALGAGLLTAFTGVVFRNATVANTDIVTGAFLLAGMAFLLLGARRNRTGWMLLAGAGFGMAAGTKYLGFLLAPPALLLAAATAWACRPACRRKLSWSLLAAAVVGAPCFVANWIVTGNPVYPARIGVGTFVLFPNYLELNAPAIGWTRKAWSFFVNPDSNNVSTLSAILLLAAVAAALAARPLLPRRGERREFRAIAFPVFGATIFVLLALQLRLYPSLTQPRQIIPLAMLSAVCAAVLFEAARRFRFFRSGWAMAALIVAVLAAASAPQFHYPAHIGGVLLLAALGGIFLWIFSRFGSRTGRIALAAAATVALVIDAGYRYGACRTVESGVRIRFISPANEAVRQLLENEAGGHGARIAFCGAYFYNFSGWNARNALLSIPVTVSGKPDNHDYRSLEEMRTPGPYELWRQRLFDAKADYLLVDTDTFAAPNPRLELDWALARPETFVKRFQGEGLTLFSIRRPQ